jgi:transcriptional regulator with PAS, ATPase and Fis domain
MLNEIKEKIWKRIAGKGASLAMIFDDSGTILWHKGREVTGNSIAKGTGFSASSAKEVLRSKQKMSGENKIIKNDSNNLSESAIRLAVRSVLVIPVETDLFLYVDSGDRDTFSPEDIQFFETTGQYLGDMICTMTKTAAPTLNHTISPVFLPAKISRYAVSDDPVLLLGETGSGKSYLARRIHQLSGKSGHFIEVHTPGLSETLLESQLFGHKKGSFTGAVHDQNGYVEEADSGTLFLDEIAEASLTLQSRILGFIDTQTYTRLGESRTRKANVRLVFATNRDLKAEVRQKNFREDLFFRLNILTINLPPLREHKEDIPRIIREHQSLLLGKTIGPKAMALFQNYDWPGNIRQLINVLKKAAIDCQGDEIGAEITSIIEEMDFRSNPHPLISSHIDLAKQHLSTGKSFWEAVRDPYLKRNLNRDEVKAIIQQTLQSVGGKYIDLLALFNLPKEDYHRFMAFLAEHQLK